MSKKKVMPVLAAAGMIGVIILIILLSSLVKRYIPTKETEDLNDYYGITAEDDLAVILDNVQQEIQGKYLDGVIYLDYDMVQGQLNERFYWDENENLLLYTTAKDVITVPEGSSEYTISKEKNSESYVIARADGDKKYVALDFVEKYTNIAHEYYDSPNRVLITSQWTDIEQAIAKKDTQVRVKGGIKSPILKQLVKGDTFTVLEEGENWSKVCTTDGLIGYMKNKYVKEKQTVTLSHAFEEETFSKITKDFTINMAWHQVTNAEANASLDDVLKGTKGINVMSPTWFYLNDNEGNIGSYASADYVKECHDQGIEVWALISNLVNTEVNTTEVLTHTSKRNNLANQVIAAAIQYNLDGINLDLEAIDSEAGEDYVQFIRELSLKCENNGIVLSVDNYVPADYNSFYDRAEQALFADYIVVMGYDEHYAGSEEGSVASIGFVSQGVTDTLQEVPADQIILGMPFYTRMWTETPKDSTGDDAESTAEDYVPYDLTSQALGMIDAENMLEVNGAKPEWSDEYGQYYAEYVNDGSTYKVWLETAESLELKLQVMSDNGLAGASFWKLGLEKSNVWDTIVKYMK